MNDSEWVKPGTLTPLLGIHMSTLRLWVSNGTIPPEAVRVFPSGHRSYHKPTIMALIAPGKQEEQDG